MTRPAPSRLVLASTAAVCALALSGCSSDDATAAPTRPPATVGYTAGDVPVLVPGAPGGPTETVEPGDEGSFANPGAYGDAEVDFVNGMVPHHGQALRMAEIAVERADDDRVVRLAERIRAGQGPEIAVMQAWLDAQGLPEADQDAGHDAHGSMRGMATPEQMFALEAAEGPEFDRMFLQLMTEHHEGALEMVEAAGSVSHPVVSEMVTDTYVTQGVEIDRMQQLLSELP